MSETFPEVEDIKKEYESKIQKLHTQFSEKNNNKTKLIEELENKIKTLKDQLSETKDSAKELADLNQIKSERDQLREDLKVLKTMLDSSNETLAKMNEKTDTETVSKKNLEDQLLARNLELHDAKEELKTLKTQCELSVQQNGLLQAHLKTVQEQVHERENERDKIKEELDKIKDELQSTQRQNKELFEKEKKLMEEVENEKKKLIDVNNFWNETEIKLNEQINQAKNQVNKEKTEFDKFKIDLQKKSEQEKNDLLSKLNCAEKKNKKDIERLEERERSWELREAEMRVRFSQLQGENDRLKDTVKNLQDTLFRQGAEKKVVSAKPTTFWMGIIPRRENYWPCALGMILGFAFGQGVNYWNTWKPK